LKIGSERMTADRWRRIEQVYHAALERDAGERTAYVAEVCRGDDDSRMEVESLLLARETMKPPSDAEDDQERKRQEALLKAAALLELNPDFPGARIRAHDEEKVIEDNATDEVKELGSGPRLEHLLKILDARGRVYLRLVTSLESQKAFAKIMEDFGRQGWFQFSGIPIESVLPLSPSATLRPPLLQQRERFLERVDFWGMEGYRRLDSLRKNQPESLYSNPTEAEVGSVGGQYTKELREERRKTELAAQRVRRTGEEAVVPAPGLPPPSSASSSPTPAANGKPRSAKWPPTRLVTIAIVISVSLASFAVALFIYRPHNRISNLPATTSTPLEAGTPLWAEHQGDDLKIMWDLDSPEVAGATSGVLDIEDGGTTQQIPMTADQVRFGSLLYSPVSDQISVRLTTFKDNRSTKRESVLVLLKEPPRPQSGKGQQIPFEAKAERVASTHVPPTGNREIKPPVLKDHAIVQTRPARVELPAPLPIASVLPPPASAAPRSEPAKPTIQASSERVDRPASPMASVTPPPATAAPRSEPAKPVTQTSSERVDRPASPMASVSPPPASAAPRSEPAKPATQTNSEPVDLSSQLPRASGSPPPTVAVPQSEPAKPQEESFVAPVLIAQEGVQTPRELLPVLTRRVAVSVRVDVNEAGRVTRAEAIPEKGIHALLLRAARDAALRCRFQPARRGQSPVSSSVTIVFHIGPENQ
jgi:hypothetical protein